MVPYDTGTLWEFRTRPLPANDILAESSDIAKDHDRWVGG